MVRPRSVYELSATPITADTHTAEGIDRLGRALVAAFVDRYEVLAECMFEWNDPSGMCDTMFEMSLGRVPEKYLIRDSPVAIFNYRGETHMLPIRKSGMLNLYDEQSSWHVQTNRATRVACEIADLRLDTSNSVIVTNSLHPTYDHSVIWHNVLPMVDAILTLHSNSITARSKYVITVDDMSDVDVNNFVNSLLSFAPCVRKNKNGAMMQPEVLNLNTAIDPGILDVISYWQSLILTYIGYDCTDTHKRAQMTVPEIVTSHAQIQARRLEKLRCRERACELWNKKFGGELEVSCIVDKFKENEEDHGLGNSSFDNGVGDESAENTRRATA